VVLLWSHFVSALIIFRSYSDCALFALWSCPVLALIMLGSCSVSLLRFGNACYDLAVFVRWSWCDHVQFYCDNALIMLCALITVNALIVLRFWSLCLTVFLWSCSVLPLIIFRSVFCHVWFCALTIFRPSSVLHRLNSDLCPFRAVAMFLFFLITDSHWDQIKACPDICIKVS